MPFDPYHKWLAIPKAHRPPTYYQLLSLATDEQDADVIEAALLRQTSYVRSFQTGPYAAIANQLLNELAEAGNTLLDPALREAYDASIPATVEVEPDESELPAARPIREVRYAATSRSSARTRSRRRRARKKNDFEIWRMVVYGCLLTIASAIVLWRWNQRSVVSEDDADNPQSPGTIVVRANGPGSGTPANKPIVRTYNYKIRLRPAQAHEVGSALRNLSASDQVEVFRALEVLKNLEPTEGRDRVARQIERLLRQQNIALSSTAAEALAVWGDERSIRQLAEAVHHWTGSTIDKAIQALGDFDSPIAVEALLELLTDSRLRFQVMLALKRMGQQAAPLVLKLLDQPDRELCSAAFEILESVGGAESIPKLTELTSSNELHLHSPRDVPWKYARTVRDERRQESFCQRERYS